ncbi:MAG TPA: ATP-binding protein [Rhizomicrobium sp.]|nr:ATP-binding protein [Rhizomicrobium sp.]
MPKTSSKLGQEQIAALEEEMRSERAQFALAERAARFGYWRLRLSDNHLTWSPGMYKLLGVDAREKADNGWLLSQIRDEDAAMIMEKVATAIKTRSPFQYRSHAKELSAVAQIVDTHGEVEVGRDGRVITVIGVCHDVTEQVNAEIDRAEAEAKYRLMTEQASDIIMLHGLGGQVLFASNALQRVLGITHNELESRGFMAFVHPDDIEEAAKLQSLPSPGQTLTASYRVRHGEGHYIWIEASTCAVYDPDTGSFRHIIGISRDITDRKTQEIATQAARESAEAASKAKSGFLASMSHELRTPLNAIIGFADVMRAEMFGYLGNKRYAEYADLIHESGQHLLDLISDILDMAKIEAGKMELNFENVDISHLVEDSARLMAQRARDGGIELTTRTPENGLLAKADHRAVKQILLNLLSNAVKFTPKGGRIVVAAIEQNGKVIIRVSDDGIGIPADVLPRLGKPFEQAATDPMIARTGTGLGLALIRALAEKHGGTMRIESVEGEGTTVTVELLAARQVQAAA